MAPSPVATSTALVECCRGTGNFGADRRSTLRMRRRQIADRGQEDADGDDDHAAQPDRQIAPQQFDVRLQLGPQHGKFAPHRSDVRLQLGPHGADFGLDPGEIADVASSAPDMASAGASAVSPACFGGKPAVSSRRASFSVSKGTAPMDRNLRWELVNVEHAAAGGSMLARARQRLRPLIEHAVLHDVGQVLALAIEERDVGERVAVDRDQVGASIGGDDAELAFAVQEIGVDGRR